MNPRFFSWVNVFGTNSKICLRDFNRSIAHYSAIVREIPQRFTLTLEKLQQ
jgi:hypothetical protein